MDSTPMDNVDAKPLVEQALELGDPPRDWSGWFAYMALKFALYVAKDPWGFFATVVMLVTPLLLISAYCAYRLAQEIKRQESGQKLKAKRSAAIAKSRKQAKID
ncbi:uncharacterized protein DEA37_0005442 [Paragonimus westermani]|uniref:Small integral membrane protein 15 n=1 Tax=Paragonimus westermani TaxID=34504 RepID=A0A5J4NIJ4_9TREM|nr:uncharacterized protein DEA37_0005442 [Paragonimus westermani]